MVMKLLDYQVAHCCFTRRRTTRNPYTSYHISKNDIIHKETLIINLKNPRDETQLSKFDQTQAINILKKKSIKSNGKGFIRESMKLPITKGCLGDSGEEEEEGRAERRWDREGTEELGGEEEEERRPSKRRPEKCGPDAFSMAQSTDDEFSGIEPVVYRFFFFFFFFVVVCRRRIKSVVTMILFNAK